MRREVHAERRGAGDLGEYCFSEPRSFRFVLDREQRETIESFAALYGEGAIGLSRTLSKVYLGRLWRKAVPLDGPQAPSTDTD